MSVKFQVTFPAPLMAQLKRESKRLDVSVAEFIRQSAEIRLREKRTNGSVMDPFAAITGLVDSKQRDLASRVDEIYD
ncbi:MAG: hypothetical protein ABI995_08400 [Acidobacteriota bacterium]